MTLPRPTLTGLIDRARADLDARLPGADSRLRRSTLDVLATVHAGAVHGLYGFIANVALQITPDTADDEGVVRWATRLGVFRDAATASTGVVTATGVDGSTIAVDQVLQRSDGVEYVVTAEAEIAGGTAAVSIEAVQPGATGDYATGGTLRWATPIGGVATAVTVAAPGLAGGLDEEPIASLLARGLERQRQPPSGGAAADYGQWISEHRGVKTRSWPYPNLDGLGTVGVAFVIDGREDIIPTVPEVAAAQAYVEARRPIGAEVTVFAPVADPLDLTIDLLAGDTAEIRAAVEAELVDLLTREAEPGGTILISHIREAISVAAGETDHVLTTPSANVTSPAGEIAVLGTITWS